MYKVYWGVSGKYGHEIKFPRKISTLYEYGEEEMGLVPREYDNKLQLGGIPQLYNNSYSFQRLQQVASKFPLNPTTLLDLESVLDWSRIKEKPLAYAASLEYARGNDILAERQYTESRQLMHLELLHNLKRLGVKYATFWGAPWFHRPFNDLKWLYDACTCFAPTFYDAQSKSKIAERMDATRRLAGNGKPVYAVLNMSDVSAVEIATLARTGKCDVILWGSAFKGTEPVKEWERVANDAQALLDV